MKDEEEGNRMEENIIICKQAAVQLDQFQIQPVNMELPKGYIIGVQGKNGSGKSTFMKMLLGRYPNMSGIIEIAGLDVLKDRELLLQQVGYIAEDREFFRELSAKENEKMYAGFYKNWSRERFEAHLKKYQVGFHAKYGTLSRGNQIKFQLAFTAAYMPKVIIMDEPTAGLDPVFRMDFVKWMQDMVAEYDTTILISSHISEELEKVTDYRIYIDKGLCTFGEVLR